MEFGGWIKSMSYTNYYILYYEKRVVAPPLYYAIKIQYLYFHQVK